MTNLPFPIFAGDPDPTVLLGLLLPVVLVLVAISLISLVLVVIFSMFRLNRGMDEMAERSYDEFLERKRNR